MGSGRGYPHLILIVICHNRINPATNSPTGAIDMSKLSWMWLLLAIVYAVFFSWYTSFGGPLTEEEIDYYIDTFNEQNPDAPAENRTNVRRFMEQDTGDDFVVVNVVGRYEKPQQIEGISPDDTTEEVLAEYMEYMYVALVSRASHPIFAGAVASQGNFFLNAPAMEHWTQAAGVRYRSRRDLLEITSNPAFSAIHEFKIAALAKTIAVSVDPWFHLGDPRLILALFLGLIGSLVSCRSQNG